LNGAAVPVGAERVRLTVPALTLFVLAGALVALRDPGAPPPVFHAAYGRGPAVAFVHGLGSKPEHWISTARRLADRHHVVLVGLPGHEGSEIATPLTLERAARALGEALDAETDEPVVLVGHSIGGLVATQLALDRPERVRGLVLVETALRPQYDEAERASMLDLLDHDYDALLRAAYLSFGRDSAQGEVLLAAACQVGPQVMKPWIRLALNADLSADAVRLQMPVLVVLSDRSWPDGENWSQTAAALGCAGIRDVDAVRVRGAGHFVMLDRPDLLAAAIRSFAARVDAGPIAAGARRPF
jgi:3-oxoadipate enol-lactonase